jgi:hypothetical protein
MHFVIDLCASEGFRVDAIFLHRVEMFTFSGDAYNVHDVISISHGMSFVFYVLSKGEISNIKIIIYKTFFDFILFLYDNPSVQCKKNSIWISELVFTAVFKTCILQANISDIKVFPFPFLIIKY